MGVGAIGVVGADAGVLVAADASVGSTVGVLTLAVVGAGVNVAVAVASVVGVGMGSPQARTTNPTRTPGSFQYLLIVMSSLVEIPELWTVPTD